MTLSCFAALVNFVHHLGVSPLFFLVFAVFRRWAQLGRALTVICQTACPPLFFGDQESSLVALWGAPPSQC